MASTFSPSLKLELIGNGDQSGTWGTTTNTNLGTLLEQAITGVRAITMVNADYTLTNLNGISDEARNAVLVIGGTNSAIRNIIAPAVNKLYVVVNNTVGGYAILVKTASSTGISVPNGAALWIYCDGNNFTIIAPYTAATTSTPIVFLGYASSTTLTVTSTPNLPIAAGQTVYNPGILYTTSGMPNNTTIVSQTSGTTGGIGVYVISNAATVGTVDYPQPIVALPVLNQIATVDYIQNKSNSVYLPGAPSADTATAAAFEGSVSDSTTLTLSQYYNTGSTIKLGQYLTSGPISDGTYVSAWGTGTEGNATFTGYISGINLTIIAGTITGTVTNSQFLQVAGSTLTSGTKISSGSGLVWAVNKSQTLGSITNPVVFNAYGPITNATVAATGALGWVILHNDLQALAVTAVRSPMISYLAPLQLANVLFSSAIANLIGTLGTQSYEAVSIKGGTITNTAITNSTVGGVSMGTNATGTKTISTSVPFNSATFRGFILSTTLTASSVSAGAIVAGQTLTGSGVTAGTTVTSAIATTTAVFTGSISGTALTVTAVASGAIVIGQGISGGTIAANTVIVSGSGTSWVVSVSQTVSSLSITASSSTWTITPSQSTGSVGANIAISGYANLTVGVNGDLWYRYS